MLREHAPDLGYEVCYDDEGIHFIPFRLEAPSWAKKTDTE